MTEEEKEHGAQSSPRRIASSASGPLDCSNSQIVARIALFLAVCGSAYLGVVSLSGAAVAGCGGGSGCNTVLSSHWAYWFGLPVSLPGFAVYSSLLASSWGLTASGGNIQHRSRQLILVLGACVVGGALWFFALQLVVLKTWCKYCLATHFSASVGAVLLIRAAAMNGSTRVVGRQVTLDGAAALVCFALLITGQVAVKTPLYIVSFSSGARAIPGQLSLHHGKFKLDARELPLLGNASATNLIVSIFDYTCTHCRALHPLLKAAEEKFNGRLGIICLPAPLDAECNPLIILTAPANQNACDYARLGLAVWRARPAVFREFDDWMFASANPPALNEALAKAEGLVGKTALDKALADSWIAHQLQADIALYQANGRAIGDAHLPQLVIGDVITHGAIDSLDELVHLLEEHLLHNAHAGDGLASSAPGFKSQ